ncbi:hypothetical protein BMETH_1020_1 [methanotrophic bacterial endosymbiont of Bathymodiolus sp.]|nr:hypothetical protein BMETH_1020_1 [methanotrophic bacterial endosymbiont of Bathymodiolus sp.]
MLPHEILGLLSPTFIRLRSGMGDALATLRALLAHFGSANCPAAYQGLKIITLLRFRSPDFQRLNLPKTLQPLPV